MILLLVASRLAGAASPYAIVDVNVVDVASGRILPHRTIEIDDHRIVAVTSRAPSSLTIVPGHGLYAVPGLWDIHAHTRADERTRRFVFPLDIANGVTGIRDMQGDCSAAPCAHDKPDSETALAWRRDIASDRLLGPRIIASSPWFDGRFAHSAGVYVIHNPAEARAAVDDAARRGSAFAKIYSTLDRASYFAVAEEAKRIGIRFGGHVPITVSAIEAARAGQWSEEHLFQIQETCTPGGEQVLRAREELMQHTDTTTDQVWDLFYKQIAELPLPTICRELVAALRTAHVAIVPTLNFWRAEDEWDLPQRGDSPLFRFVPVELRKDWAKERSHLFSTHNEHDRAALHRDYRLRLQMVAELHRQGVLILPGTDSDMPFTVPGFDLHEELKSFVEAGFTPLAALRSATLAASHFLGLKDAGEIRSGYLADLVLVERNPLADIGNLSPIDAVVVNGRYLSRAHLDRVLADVVAFSSSP